MPWSSLGGALERPWSPLGAQIDTGYQKSIRGLSKGLPQETSKEAENSDFAGDILNKSTLERN